MRREMKCKGGHLLAPILVGLILGSVLLCSCTRLGSENGSTQMDYAPNGLVAAEQNAKAGAQNVAEQNGDVGMQTAAEQNGNVGMQTTPLSQYFFCMEEDERKAFAENAVRDSKIPTVFVYTADSEQITSLDEYVTCLVDVVAKQEGYDLTNVSAGIKIRGNSTAYYGDIDKVTTQQVPYRIKFDKKENLLGLNNGAKCKSWVFLRPTYEIIRQDMIFKLGRNMMHGNFFCSDGAIVKVYVNGLFKGVYQLCEQSQVNKNRVDIYECPKNYKGTDIGYYVELDNYPEEPFFVNTYCDGAKITDIYGVNRKVVEAEYSIKSDIYSVEQKNFIADYINNVYNVIYNACEKGKYLTINKENRLVDSHAASAQEAVSAVLDIESAVDMYILHELGMSWDCGEGSFYMCVDFSKKSKIKRLTFTTPWDFNWTNEEEADFFAGCFRTGSMVKQFGDRSNPWFILLVNQKWFRELAAERIDGLLESGVFADVCESEKRFIEENREELGKLLSNGACDRACEVADEICERAKKLVRILSE